MTLGPLTWGRLLREGKTQCRGAYVSHDTERRKWLLTLNFQGGSSREAFRVVYSPVSAKAHLTLRWYSPAKSAYMYGKHSFLSLLCRMYFMPLALL